MRVLVWDASAAVKLVASEPGAPHARAIFATDANHCRADWTAIEIANVLWKRCVRGQTDSESALLAHSLFTKLDFTTRATGDYLDPALRIALTHSHPVYDCLYLALAVAEDAALVTADSRLRDIALSLGIDVTWIDSSI